MKPVRWKIVGFVIAASLAVLWAIGNDKMHADAQTALLKIYKSISIKGSIDDVMAKAAEQRLDSRRIDWRGRQLLIVETPLRFGAGNWRLIVLGDPDSREIGAFGIRMEDGLPHHPADAPDDHVSPDYEKIWQKHMRE